MLAYYWNFLGLSTETKPLSGEKVVDGSTFYECDTSTFFIYYQGKWYQQTFVTEDGINFWLYKALMKKMFGKWFDGNISLGKVIKPTTGTEIEFTNFLPAQITDLTGYGDTTQQTYSGKNLFDRANATENKILTWATAVDYTDTGSLVSDFISVSEGDKFASNYFMAVFFYDSSDTYLGCLLGGGTAIGKSAGDYFRTVTVPSEYSIAKMRVVYRKSQSENPSDMTTVNDIMLNSGTIYQPYEPYTGGIPSPNPDYPQNVNVVTGEQTVTVSDGGGNTQTYTIDLGSTELCKIGDYQDYIYKSGDDWYVHKENGKSNLGDLAWFTAGTNVSGVYRMTSSSLQGTIKPATSSSAVGNVICSHFTPVSANNTYACVTGVAISTEGSVQPYSPDYNSSSSASDFKTWLTNNNVTLFYALATPTDTKITDSTLISNLNSLLNYMFPAGDHQIVITADDLPMALKLTITEKE